MAIEKTIDINVDIKGNGEIKELGESIKGVDNQTQGLTSSLDDMPGATGGAVKGVKALLASFRALLANPIGIIITAVVGALTLLFKVFQRTAIGGDKVAKVFEGISAALGPVLDSLGKFANGLVDFLSGDFQKGIDEMGSSFNGLGKEIETAYLNAGKLVDLRRELRQMNRDLTEGEAELSAQMEKQRSILDDTSLSLEERIAANDRLNELNKTLLKSRQDLIDKQLEEAEIQKEQAGLDDDEHQDALDRIAELNAAKINAQAESFRIDKEFVVKRNELINQEAAEQKRLFDEAKARREEEIRLEQEYLEKRNTTLGASKSKAVEIEQNYTEAIKELAVQKTGVDDKILQNAIDNIDAERNAKWQLFGAVQSILASGEQLAEKSAKKQKALAIASALMSTFQAAAQSLADWTSLNPIQKIAGMATVLASGLAQVASIKRTNTSIGASSVGGSATSTFTPNVQQTPNFNIIGNSLSNQIGSVINGQFQQPVKAYVVAGEVTTAQSLELNAIKTATFG